MTTVSILQPGYIPWLGFFEQMDYADIFVVYDDVQYDKNGWRNRNRIKTPQGIQWLTIPVLTSSRMGQLVNEVEVDNRTNWRSKHIKAIELNYKKAPFFNDYFPFFEDVFSREWTKLIHCDMFIIYKIREILGINKPLFYSSELLSKGKNTDRLISMCKELNADEFYEGSSGRNYIDDKIFEDNGIKITYQDYQHPVYPQLYGDFIPYLSVIDLIFNCGKESLKTIQNKNISSGLS